MTVVGRLLRLRAYRPVRRAERIARRIPPVDRLARRAYARHKTATLMRLTAGPGVREVMLGQGPLPTPFHEGMDERVIEYPWVLARLPAGPGRLLDAGSTLNHDWVADHPAIAGKDVLVCTLAPEGVLGRRNFSYLYADLRDLVLRDDAMDVIVCISTLEHVGMDNRAYTGDAADASHDPDAFQDVVRELRRVLRPGGDLLLTVPFGRAEALGWLQPFDAGRLARVIEAFGGHVVARDFFRHDPGVGWQRRTEDECRDVAFVHRQGADGVETRAGALACLALRRPAHGSAALETT